ncbi:MAG: lipase family protein [Deltaproteobacteria bacterium]|nr:lipase family protein [Deltaproteobacteria bacterium]
MKRMLLSLLFPTLAFADITATNWSVLVFHACEQVMDGHEPDFSQEVSHRTLLLKEIHPPVPTGIYEGYSKPRILWGTSGTSRWLRGRVKKHHPNGIITFNKKQNSIIVAFRGTKEFMENVNNFNAGITGSESLRSVGFGGKLHAGYVNLFESLVGELEQELLEIIDDTGITGPILVTGHSLGGSLATIAAAYLSHHPDIANPVRLVSFGSPYVGYEDFAGWAVEGMEYAVAYIRETDLAPSFVADFVGTRLSWEEGGLPDREEQYGKRSYVGSKVILPSYGASHVNFPKAHSMALYRQAVFERAGLAHYPLYNVIWSWPFEDEKVIGDEEVTGFDIDPRFFSYQQALPYLLRNFFHRVDE